MNRENDRYGGRDSMGGDMGAGRIARLGASVPGGW